MNECRWVGNSPTFRLLALTPVLVLLPAESPGSVGQGKNMAAASGQVPQPCSLQPLHSTPGSQPLCLDFTSFWPLKGLGALVVAAAWVPRGKVSGSGAGPPSPRPPRLPPTPAGFLPLTPGAVAGGCWASADKGLAAWPRLIRSQADPGGNQRAGISKIGLSPRPRPVGRTGSDPSSGLHLPSSQSLEGPWPLRTSPSAQLHRGETEAGQQWPPVLLGSGLWF